jgi:hypothetical protein
LELLNMLVAHCPRPERGEADQKRVDGNGMVLIFAWKHNSSRIRMG